MKSLLSYSLLIALPAVLWATSEIYPGRPFVIEGNIIQSSTGKSVENAYLYIISGEEEALSRKDGSFTISTWQNFPVTLIIEHPLYKHKRITLKDALSKPVIKLEPK